MSVVEKTNPHLFFLPGEAPGAPGLRGARCTACGGYTLGRVSACQHCFSTGLEAVGVGSRAELIEHSVVHHPAGGFDAPYVIGQIRTAEGLSLFAPLVGETSGLKRGTPLGFRLLDRPGGAVGFAYEVPAREGSSS